jgi:hypothetical protein
VIMRHGGRDVHLCLWKIVSLGEIAPCLSPC